MDSEDKTIAIFFCLVVAVVITAIICGTLYYAKPSVIQGSIVEKCLGMNHTIAECKELTK